MKRIQSETKDLTQKDPKLNKFKNTLKDEELSSDDSSDEEFVKVGDYEFKQRKLIEHGSTCSVYKGHQISNQKNKVAIKVLKQDINSTLKLIQ